MLSVEEAFRQARKVLKFLARSSALAKKFYDMLSSLLEAVMMLRRRQLRDAVGSSDVPLLVAFGSNEENAGSVGSRTELPQPVQTTGGQNIGMDSIADVSIESLFSPEEWEAFTDQFYISIPSENNISIV